MMSQLTRKFMIKSIYVGIDVLFMVLSIYLACLIRPFTLSFDVTIGNLFFSSSNPFRFIFLFWMLSVVLINNSNGLYQTKREIYETDEIGKVIKSVIISTLMTIVLIYTIRFDFHPFPRSVVYLVSILMILFFSLWRVLKRILVHYLVSQGYNNFNVLIIGAGKVGKALEKEINKRPGLGLKLIGYLDDFKVSGEEEETKVLGKLNDFFTVARRQFVHEIFITTHHDDKTFLKLLEQSKELGIAVRVVPHGYELMTSDYFKYNIGIIPVLQYFGGSVLRKQAGKRIFDLIVSLFLLVILSPGLFLIAILIKIESPGHVFYQSKRFGRRGRTFNMHKFRSMVKDADRILNEVKDKNEVDGPIFKMKNDPRVTGIGKFLRKYSLDELPQLFNVINGDMSLVGPRPLPISQIEREDLKQLKRLEVRPGITGLWQIRGRSDISFSRLLRWDVWYINNWSFLLDINILFQTLPVVVKGKGAY